jgi:hypothetical protein
MPSYFTFTVSSFVLPYLSIYSGRLVLLPSVHRPISPIRPPLFFLFSFPFFPSICVVPHLDAPPDGV